MMKRCNWNSVTLFGLHPFLGASVQFEHHKFGFDFDRIFLGFFTFRMEVK